LIAVILAVKGELTLAAFFVLLGIFFDFFDGLVARSLSVSGELGKQLDSLADMVTSGVVPGIVMYKLLETSQNHTQWFSDLSCTVGSWAPTDDKTFYFFPFLGLILTLAAAYRLANFNIDDRQTSSFIGLPTPALALLVISLPLIQQYSTNTYALALTNNKLVLISIIVIGSILMNANIPLFSLKFKIFSFRENALVYVFLLISLILLISLKFVAVPLIILIYVLLSVVRNLAK